MKIKSNKTVSRTILAFTVATVVAAMPTVTSVANASEANLTTKSVSTSAQATKQSSAKCPRGTSKRPLIGRHLYKVDSWGGNLSIVVEAKATGCVNRFGVRKIMAPKATIVSTSGTLPVGAKMKSLKIVNVSNSNNNVTAQVRFSMKWGAPEDPLGLSEYFPSKIDTITYNAFVLWGPQGVQL